MNSSSITYVLSGSWDWDGTKTQKGVFLYRFHEVDGTMELLDSILPEVKVGCTPVQGRNDHIYIVEERGALEGRRSGGGGYLWDLHMNRDTEKLEVLGKVETHAVNPSYCAVSPDQKYICVVHHTSTRNTATKLKRKPDGSVLPVIEHDDAAIVLFALKEDGSIGDLLDFDFYADEDSKVSLLHSVYFVPDTDLLIAGDKGLDHVHVWRISEGHLERVMSVRTLDGSDTRYAAFHPSLPLFYVNNEQKPVVYVFRYDKESVSLEKTVASLEEGESCRAMASDLIVTPDGKHLYNALRMCDRIAQFDLDEEGVPHLVQTVDGWGSHSRGMAISLDGRFLYVCCMESDCISVFRISPEDGHLEKAFRIPQSRASNLTFLK